MSKSNLDKSLDDARDYIKKHLVECCQEILDFHDSTVLRSGRVREAAAIYSKVVPQNQALKMATDEAARQAMTCVTENASSQTTAQSVWTRKCQECGNRQACKEPVLPLSDAYRNSKCRSCRSESLDYGSGGWLKHQGRYVQEEES